jgi:cytochrome P450
VPTAVEEMLRWASSTPYNRRTVTRDVEVGAQMLRAGDKVTLWWASANRDEREFAEPNRFDIARTPNRHLAFGHGPHFCLGARLARLEIRVLLEELLARVASVVQLGPIEWTRSNKHTGVRHLPVELVAR